MKLFTIIFGLFVAAAEIDICVPSFPLIAKDFNLSTFAVEFVLTINLIFHCISAIFIGKLGDKYHKKTVINYAICIFIIGSIVALMAKNYPILLIGRILQGIGAAGPMILISLFVLDIYPQEKQQRIMNAINGVTTFAICFAPTLGAYATLLFGWRSNFLILCIIGIISIVLNNLYLPKDPVISNKETKAVKYREIFSNKTAMLYIFCCNLAIGMYYTFVAMSPILYINDLNVKIEHFGFYQGALTLTFGIFSILSGKISDFIGAKRAFFGSLVLIMCYFVSTAVILIYEINNPIIITASILFLSIGCVIPINTVYLLGLNAMPEAKGQISAMITIGKWILASLGIQTASFFYNHSYSSIGITMICMEAAAIAIGIFIWRNDSKFKESVLNSAI